jgi:hypothetical protein
MFGSVSEHFANLRHVKDEKLIFRAWMHYFGVPKFWIIHSSPLDPMMFGSVSEHFANLRHVKDAKPEFWAWMHYFGVPKFWSIHSSPLVPKWCLGVFRSISQTLGTSNMKNSCYGPDYTISGYQSSEASILVHWSQNDVWECFGAFRKPSARQRWKTHVTGLNTLFRGTKVLKHPF